MLQHTLTPESSLTSVLFLSSFLARSYTALCSTFVALILLLLCKAGHTSVAISN
jgi:hypothetical protein